MRYYEIPEDTFNGLVTESGLLLKNFDIDAAISDVGNPGFSNSDIITATTGGIQVSLTPTYSDLGEDVDNCPVNMMELKHLDSTEAKISTTAFSMTPENIRRNIGAADIDSTGKIIVPRTSLNVDKDFQTIWWVSDKADGGFVAVKMTNALSTSGLTIQTGKATKGNTSLELTGHVSLKAQNVAPMTFYSIVPSDLPLLDMEPESQDEELFEHLVSEMQSADTAVNGRKITGTLHFIEGGLASSGPLAGDGNFLALKFNAEKWADYTSVKVGLEPSQQTGLVEIINDPDKNGVFKVAGVLDGVQQKFKIVATDGTDTITQIYDISGLVLETE